MAKTGVNLSPTLKFGLSNVDDFFKKFFKKSLENSIMSSHSSAPPEALMDEKNDLKIFKFSVKGKAFFNYFMYEIPGLTDVRNHTTTCINHKANVNLFCIS
ncbi:hypothetical protein BpHYR1_001749 [Brachionus plicatilis]|uniref:Uncharacterized protein n=1 Tax=Brachionus plicatilis TaxID=10195 RepID=A0A3M7RCS0_BRAPC|nr:hypothetical protein BpHYR1_001749 [Brachionus plicatilis]